MAQTTLSWIGGGNDNFSNANDWSPSEVPEKADILNVPNATPAGITMNVDGESGYTLTTLFDANGGTATYNIDNSKLTLNSSMDGVGGGLYDINASGKDHLAITDSGSILETNVTIQADAALTLSGTMFFSMQESGGANSKLVNDGTMNLMFNSNTIGSNLTGKGTINLAGFADEGGGLTLGGSVGAGQTIEIPAHPDFTQVLTVNHASEFKGLIDLIGTGQVTLDDLTATSWNYSRNKMSLYNGNKLVDTVRLDDPNNNPLYVTSGSNSVSIFDSNPGGTVLPLHTAPCT